MSTYPEVLSFGDVVSAWNARVERNPHVDGIRYFDGRLSVSSMDAAANSLAQLFIARGVEPGDRIGISLQNIPAFPLVMLGIWKAGGAVLLLNPAYRREELAFLLQDSGACGVICAPEAVDLMKDAAGENGLGFVWTASNGDFQSRMDPRYPEQWSTQATGNDITSLMSQQGTAADPGIVRHGDAPALLAYTSGTTGPPKGAVNTDRNILSVVSAYAPAVGVGSDDVVLAVAPFFHITGAVVTLAMALLGGCELVLTGRFQPEIALDAFREHGVTHTIGAITAFNAITRLKGVSGEELRSVRSLYSGGAPVPPAVVEEFEQRFGVYIHNAYGMTETTSGVIAVPHGSAAPVDPGSGTLSIGRALSGVDVRIIDETGRLCRPGEVGELQLRGPQVISEYWGNAEATTAAFTEGWLKTGDVAFIDDGGWVYLVDRLKDQINVSGYKVWPREVEDVLYQHPAIHEVAVVGRPDEYQGESVAAFICVRPEAEVSSAEVVEFVKQRLAPYKVPRHVEFVDELPKTQTGKIKRRDLR